MADIPVQVEATEPVVDAVAAESTTAAQEPAVESTETKTEESTEASKQEESTEAQSEVKAEAEPEAATSTEAGTEAGGMLKTTARAYTNHRKNKKFDPSILPETDDPSAIRAQVEFYFSDNNLPKDEFLWNLTGGAENKPVEIAKLHTFGRMRRFQPYAAVVKALRDSSSLVVSGEEGQELVARKTAYDPSKARKVMPCSVYVKGFGDEQPSTQFDIEAFFAQFETVKAIRLRRTPDNLFKGSVFVEFETEEQAKAFLALDPAPKWQGHELKIMSKQAYVDEKSKLIEEGKLQPSERRAFFEGRNAAKERGHGGRGGKHFNKDRNADSDDWKARKFEDRKHGGHRGGRGRGRGGRGRGGRGGRGPRDRNDENRGEKRSRDDEASGEQPPAKKVDAKPAEAAPAAAAE